MNFVFFYISTFSTCITILITFFRRENPKYFWFIQSTCYFWSSTWKTRLDYQVNTKLSHAKKFGSFYFSASGKSTAGAILPLAKPDWLNWSCYKDDMLGLLYRSCNVTKPKKTKYLNPNPKLSLAMLSRNTDSILACVQVWSDFSCS